MAEEKKLNVVKGDTNNVKNEEPSKEQLKNWCDQLLSQRNQLAQRLNQVTDVLNKLPWLFEVVKNREVFNSNFVDICIKDIEDIMTPPKEEIKQENNE